MQNFKHKSGRRFGLFVVGCELVVMEYLAITMYSNRRVTVRTITYKTPREAITGYKLRLKWLRRNKLVTFDNIWSK